YRCGADYLPLNSVANESLRKFLLLNLSNADQANQDVRQRLAQVAPGLDLVHYNIGSIELNRKSFQATGKLILNYASVELHSLTMHLSPPLSQQSQHRLFRQDVRAATNNARGADSSAAGFSRNRDSDSAGAAANQFNAKVMLDADQICFALREGRTSILDVKLDKIEASLKRIAKKYSLKASLGSLSALGYDGRQLVATEACRCCHTKLPNGQSKFVKLCRPDKSPYILDIGACRIVHCVSTANRLANFFQVSSSSSAADEAEEAEPELDEELLKTLRFLTRRGVGRNGAGRSGGTAEKDRHRFRGHLDGLSFHLPTGPLSSDRGLTCLMDEVELLWLKTGPAESN
uniref:VPS13_mid_rpt domain-containing protein n=2 Tax=Macrostomum lignano TaxID=282301 RepID=A0A1I8JMG8_9PLAT